ncbi:U-box domain-containing protein 15-like [Dorcoceras hygrometricum]|uniref:U-box domain-containing protein 15-like n=1 Tax=Dorcoceras hygrometricum TaxID=472368 RepID=A0A2Z7CNP8_9LAMI|nr:U-box domain-containing protein 15-like [Dorcoceras hygrometricum]
MDLMIVFSGNEDRDVDGAVIERIAKKLELHTAEDLKAETTAVSKLVKAEGSLNPENIQRVADLLQRFKQIAGIDGDNRVLDMRLM